MRNNSEWLVMSRKSTGYLTISEVKRFRNGRLERGFFKHASKAKQRKYIGPLAANELIANRLAAAVRLPAAKTELVTIGGHLGIVSMQQGQQVWQWRQLRKKLQGNMLKHIRHPERLYKTFVFDVWICNIDRSDKNIITYRKGRQYDFYLIDHELSLLGAVRFENRPLHARYWHDVHAYTRGYDPVLLPYVIDEKQVRAHVRQIQSIKRETIRAAINSCPKHLLSHPQRMAMEKILLHRQRHLHRMVARCIANRR